ncbi:MAG: DUF2953 domain-containing protein [Clostridia bacterium]|nr:DUF2953 domain-containing protein [Clostridia bacterium]
MVLLKILFWLIFIVLVLAVLIIGFVLFALSVKIQIIGDYADEKKRFWVKYGIIKLKVYPEMFSEKAKRRRAKLMGYIRSWFGPTARKVSNKAKAKATEKFEETKEKKAAEKDLNTAVEIREEEKRIAEEERRLNEEIPRAQASYEAAVEAEEKGEPLPNVVNQDEVSKIESIKTSWKAADIPGTYDKVKSFLSGFSTDSILALISSLGSDTGHTLGKVGRRIVIKRFNVGLVVSGKDAASTALKYGRIAAVAYPSLGRIMNSLNTKDVSLDMTPDYLAKKDSGEIHVTVAFRPLFLFTPFIGLVPRLGKDGFKFYRDYSKTKKVKSKNASQAGSAVA